MNLCQQFLLKRSLEIPDKTFSYFSYTNLRYLNYARTTSTLTALNVVALFNFTKKSDRSITFLKYEKINDLFFMAQKLSKNLFRGP